MINNYLSEFYFLTRRKTEAISRSLFSIRSAIDHNLRSSSLGLTEKRKKIQLNEANEAQNPYLENLLGAPNDGFLPIALKRCFRLSGVLLKLCRLILGCAIKFLSVRSF